ncbi:MAG: DUF1501 domain-containing protein [Acidobacteria bacterium]|nr:DUF1501 domain-containing protein [Acidobacteriota bacterium]
MTTRRDFFSRMANGVHGMALTSLLGAERSFDLTSKPSHFPGKAKAVIHLFMNGGPSQVDLFDPKPALTRMHGTPPSRELAYAISNGREAGNLMGSPFEFKPRGKSGIEISNALPHLAGCVDDIAFLRSMYGEHANHEPALFLIHSGRTVASRPAIGSWVAYGLGTENQNLPAYVVLDDPKGLPINGISNWQSAWLPPIYQGTRFRTEGTPVLNLQPRPEIPTPLMEAERNLVRQLDAAHKAARPHQPELDARISSFELAARMQMAATDALDLSTESPATREAYGLNDTATESYGKRCLMARRLVERGVRFVQLYIESQIFDSHGDLKKSLGYACGKTDQPIAALLKDLKQRGLLDSTLVVYGGEFGRLPISQGKGDSAGRDHGPQGFTSWLAGGGVKGGVAYGATDDIGFKAVEKPVSVHDFHATILHCLGLNHRDLVLERHGLKERLTDQFPARVVREILS